MTPWLRALAGAAILAALLWWHSTAAFTSALRVIDARAAAAALGIGLLTTLCSAWRWRLVARRLGLRLPPAAAVAAYYRALFLNAVLPAGVLGDVHRAVSHGRNAGDVRRGVRAVVLERAAGQAVLIAAGTAVLLIARPALLPAVAVLPAAVLALTRWKRPRRALTAVRRTLLTRDTWPGVVLLSAAALAGHLALFVVAARLAGATAPVAALAGPLLLALLVMALPVSIGGWGPREAASALAFGATGLGAEQGLTTAVVYGVLTLIASFPGAVALLVRREHRQAVTERRDQRREDVPALAGRRQ